MYLLKKVCESKFLQSCLFIIVMSLLGVGLSLLEVRNLLDVDFLLNMSAFIFWLSFVLRNRISHQYMLFSTGIIFLLSFMSVAVFSIEFGLFTGSLAGAFIMISCYHYPRVIIYK